MNLEQIDDRQWLAERLQDRVSYTGWFLAIMAGLWLWSIAYRLVF